MSLPFPQQPGVIFGIAAGLSWLAHRLKMPHVLLLLLAGALLGVDGLGWWVDTSGFELFAHIGIAALLFLVGLELSPAFFREVGLRPVKLLIHQVGVLGVLGGLWASGFSGSWGVLVIVALLFTFNSTMLALKTLGERQELGKTHGRLVASVLILQDVLASALLVGINVAESMQVERAWWLALALYLVKIAVLAAVCWLFATHALSRMWRSLARQHEVFILAGFAYPLLVGAVFSGVGLSAELGALVAGISLAHSDFRFELLTRMKPLREIFLAPFFLMVGAGWAWHSLPQVWLQVLIGWLIVGFVGPLAAVWALRRAQYPRTSAVAAALHLTSGSEFVFLVLALVAGIFAVSPELQVALVSIVVISMISGSLLMQITPQLVKTLRRTWPETSLAQIMPVHPPEMVLFGCHRVGSDFLPVLKRLKRPFTVVDMDPQVIQDLTSHHVSAVFGDLNNRELLEELGVHRSRLLVSTVHDKEAQIALLRYLKRHHAKPVVIMVAHEVEEALELYKHGASYVILPHFLGGNYASQLIDIHGYEDPEPFEVERLRHVEHLKKRGKAGIFLPFSPSAKRG